MDDPWGSPWTSSDPGLVPDVPVAHCTETPVATPVHTSQSPWANEEDGFGDWSVATDTVATPPSALVKFDGFAQPRSLEVPASDSLRVYNALQYDTLGSIGTFGSPSPATTPAVSPGLKAATLSGADSKLWGQEFALPNPSISATVLIEDKATGTNSRGGGSGTWAGREQRAAQNNEEKEEGVTKVENGRPLNYAEGIEMNPQGVKVAYANDADDIPEVNSVAVGVKDENLQVANGAGHGESYDDSEDLIGSNGVVSRKTLNPSVVEVQCADGVSSLPPLRSQKSASKILEFVELSDGLAQIQDESDATRASETTIKGAEDECQTPNSTSSRCASDNANISQNELRLSSPETLESEALGDVPKPVTELDRSQEEEPDQQQRLQPVLAPEIIPEMIQDSTSRLASKTELSAATVRRLGIREPSSAQEAVPDSARNLGSASIMKSADDTPIVRPLDEYGDLRFTNSQANVDELFDLSESGNQLSQHDASDLYVPDFIIEDSFTSVSERKRWYRISRQGSMRSFAVGDDCRYRRITWATSTIRMDTVKIVRRWMEEDSLTGRPALGGSGIRGNVFGWDSTKEPIALDAVYRRSSSVSHITASPAHTHRHRPSAQGSSVDSAVDVAEAAAATFAWSSSLNSGPGQAKKQFEAPSLNLNTVLSPTLVPVLKPNSVTVSDSPMPLAPPTPASPAAARKEVRWSLPPSFGKTSQLGPLNRSNESANAIDDEDDDEDDDEWGEMVSSPAQATFSGWTEPATSLSAAVDPPGRETAWSSPAIIASAGHVKDKPDFTSPVFHEANDFVLSNGPDPVGKQASSSVTSPDKASTSLRVLPVSSPTLGNGFGLIESIIEGLPDLAYMNT